MQRSQETFYSESYDSILTSPGWEHEVVSTTLEKNRVDEAKGVSTLGVVSK